MAAGSGRFAARMRTPADPAIELAEGFTSRVVGRTGERVGGVTWHQAPDDGACFADGDGWIYVSNSEIPLLGGVSALKFGPDGSIRSGYRILSGTDSNRAGGATSWNTWLSCEDSSRGRVFECDPYGHFAAMPRLAMGLFRHESAVCDETGQVVYLTEDHPEGCLYRFRPVDWRDLTTGVLEVMVGDGPGKVTWSRVPNPAATDAPTRDQVEGAVRFQRAGRCSTSGGFCHFSTDDDRVWSYDPSAGELAVLYGADPRLLAGAGDLFVTRDGEIDIIDDDGAVTPLLRVGGPEKSIAGLAFSPDGERLYFSSRTGGVTYEVTGPFKG
ncbi:alkaline phosphatase PhoX [Herbidospora cretacea]|uniref:alkaline phosphatase PhoX n=1 Tax=Herbidospora cretacea TaxID=28444 RepID=UPI000A536310|nr:alkaline phosphatase PhoX [Herbidospora cretacea]